MPTLRIAACWLAVVALSATGCVSLFDKQLERRMLFHPLKVQRDVPVPDGVESVWIEGPEYRRRTWTTSVADHYELHGLLAEAPDPARRRAVALYCHGNAGCVDGCAEKIRLTADRFNVTILAFDYRGFGRSEGTPETEGIVDDGRAARKWLAARTNQPEQEIVLIGESLGGATAVEMAGRDGCRGLVLLSTFSSLGDIAEVHAPAFLQPRKVVGNKLDSCTTIKNYHGPLLQRHGDADRVIPLQQGQRLFDAAPGPKKFVLVPEGGHDGGGTDEFYAALEEFFVCIPPYHPAYLQPRTGAEESLADKSGATQRGTAASRTRSRSDEINPGAD